MFDGFQSALVGRGGSSGHRSIRRAGGPQLRRLGTSTLVVATALSVSIVVTAPTSASASPRRSTIEAGPGGTFIPAPFPPARTPSRAPEFSPNIHDVVVASSNWSGYAQSAKTKGLFTAVTDTWKVPTVSTTPSGSQYASDWVGIGGYSDRTLVQAGTDSDNINGTAQYDAWTEILPAPSVNLPMTISPGDSITTVVRETSPGIWLMQVTDNTTSVTKSQTVSYASSGKSVEAIHEATSICSARCTVATLATTTNVTFDPGSYTSNLQPSYQPLLVPAIQKKKVTKKRVTTQYAKLDELVMVSKTDATIATPSSPDSDNDGFTVADGAVPPAPPSS